MNKTINKKYEYIAAEFARSLLRLGVVANVAVFEHFINELQFRLFEKEGISIDTILVDIDTDIDIDGDTDGDTASLPPYT